MAKSLIILLDRPNFHHKLLYFRKIIIEQQTKSSDSVNQQRFIKF